MFLNFVNKSFIFRQFCCKGNISEIISAHGLNSSKSFFAHYDLVLNSVSQQNHSDTKSLLFTILSISTGLTKESLKTAEILKELATLSFNLKEFELSMSFYVQAFNSFNNFAPNTTNQIFECGIEIADFYNNSNESEKAEEYLVNLLPLTEYLENKATKLRFYELLGKVKIVKNNYETAIKYLELGKLLFFDTNFDHTSNVFCSVLVSLANSYSAQLDYAKAIENYLQAVNLFIQANDYKNVINFYQIIFCLYFDYKKPDKAIEIVDKACEYFYHNFENQDIRIMDDFFVNSENKVKETQDYQNLAEFLHEKLKFDEKYSEEYSEKVANTNFDLSQAYFHVKNYKNSIIYAENTLRIRKKLKSPKDLIEAYNLFFSIYLQTEEFDYCLYSLAEVEKILKKHPIVELQKKYFYNMYLLYNHKKDYIVAQKWLIKYFHEISKDTPENNEEICKTYFLLGNLARILENYEESIENLNKSIKIAEKIYGKVHISTATLIDHLALSQAEAKNFEKAIQLNLKSLNIKQSLFGDFSLNLEKNFIILVKNLLESKKFEEAAEFAKKRIEVFVQHYGNTNKLTAEAYVFLGKVFMQSGNKKLSVQAFEQAEAIYGELNSFDEVQILKDLIEQCNKI